MKKEVSDTGVSAVMGLVYDWPVFGDLLAQSFLALDMTTSASDHAFPPGSCHLPRNVSFSATNARLNNSPSLHSQGSLSS